MTAKKALSEDMESEMRQRKTQILNSADFRKYISKFIAVSSVDDSTLTIYHYNRNKEIYQ